MLRVKMKHKKMIIAVIFITVMSTIYFLKHKHSPIKYAINAVNVEVQKVKVGSIPLTLQTVGTLVAAKSVKIAPEISGKIAKIFFQDGSFVKAGTPLIKFEDSVNNAKLIAVRADLSVSEKNYVRMQILAKKGIISRQEIEKSFADLQEKRSSEKEIEVMVNEMLLVAPFDGVLDKVKISEGNFVSAGQELVTITDTHHLHVEYNIPEKYLGLLKINQEVSITTSAFPDKKFIGKIAFVAPTINTQDRTVSVYAEVPNDSDLLLAGLFVNVTHSFGFEEKALLIPAVSLMATIDGQEVFKVVNGKAQAVPVVVGQRTDSHVQVLKGLSTGDEVIVAGQFKVKDGTEVNKVPT